MPEGSEVRRANGEGTIYQRSDGRWCAQVTTSIDPITGNTRRKTFYGRTYEEVADKANNHESSRRGAVSRYEIPEESSRLEETIESWLAQRLSRTRKRVERQWQALGGRTDIVTESEVVEVKRLLDTGSLFQAAGQLLVYGDSFPGRRLVIAGCLHREKLPQCVDALTAKGIDVWVLRPKGRSA